MPRNRDRDNNLYLLLKAKEEKEKKEPISIVFLPTATLQEKSMRLHGISFANLSDETRAIFIKVLLENKPAAQTNMLKNQAQFDIDNLRLITIAALQRHQPSDALKKIIAIAMDIVKSYEKEVTPNLEENSYQRPMR